MKTGQKFFLLIAIIAASCGTVKVLKNMGDEKVTPQAFKTVFPFTMPNKQSIHIITYWGENGTRRVLKFDNHAPTAADTSVLLHTPGMTWIGDIFVGKPLPDGRKIPNRFYKYSGIKLGDVTFSDVVFNEVPMRNTRDTGIIQDDGLFGDNLMRNGVWKIDFEHMEMTFASHIDSLGSLDDMQKVAARFDITNNVIFKVKIADTFKTELEMDLGYNNAVIIPGEDFKKIPFSAPLKYKTASMTTAGGKQTAHYTFVEKERVRVGDRVHEVPVVSNDLNKKKSLLGLKFFSAFRSIIIDYPGKKFYVSKAMLHQD